MNQDLVSLKLHVVDDNVWSLYGEGPPRNTGMSVLQFMLSAQARTDCVRLMGTEDNAQLILALYQQRLERNVGCVEVCSPMACRTAAEQKDPVRALLAMRKYNKTAGMGGWHVFRNV